MSEATERGTVELETTVEYGVFNDEAAWGPLFDAGEISSELREVILDRPLFASVILREAAQHARLTNEERALQQRLDKFGHVVVRTQTTTRTPWRDVPRDEVAEALGEL